MSSHQPDYRQMLDVMNNRRPAQLPIYEHIISAKIIERILGKPMAELEYGDRNDQDEFFRHYCGFFKRMTYDTVSYEVCICGALPDSGALMGGRPGPIQTRQDFEQFPWDEIPARFWAAATPRFDALAANLPEGMKAVGGIGNGVFEISEDLVGYEYLGFMMVDDPELFTDLYRRIGDLMLTIWQQFLERYTDTFAVCRFGDDLGFKTATLINPKTIREHIIPQYQRVVNAVHAAGRPFLWHSCGNIFDIMDDVIAIGINAKHSNEDVIAPFHHWINSYNDRIGLLGGIDLDILCVRKPEEISEYVFEKGCEFRNSAKGYALGSGNSIPDYVPVDGYLAMIEAAKKIREQEKL